MRGDFSLSGIGVSCCPGRIGRKAGKENDALPVAAAPSDRFLNLGDAQMLPGQVARVTRSPASSHTVCGQSVVEQRINAGRVQSHMPSPNCPAYAPLAVALEGKGSAALPVLFAKARRMTAHTSDHRAFRSSALHSHRGHRTSHEQKRCGAPAGREPRKTAHPSTPKCVKQ